MKQVTDFKDLKQGDKLVRLTRGKVKFYEFLMVHPHNDEYVLLLNQCQTVDRLFIPDCIGEIYIDGGEQDKMEWYEYKRDYHLKEAEFAQGLVDMFKVVEMKDTYACE